MPETTSIRLGVEVRCRKQLEGVNRLKAEIGPEVVVLPQLMVVLFTGR